MFEIIARKLLIVNFTILIATVVISTLNSARNGNNLNMKTRDLFLPNLDLLDFIVV